MSSVLGVLFAIVLGALALPSWLSFEQRSTDAMKASAAASQMKQVDDAAQGYIQANYSAVVAGSTATSPAVITPAMLQATGYMPSSFQNVSPYGQDYVVKVLQPSAGQLAALVLTQNGRAIAQKDAPEIAARLGAQGGFVPYAGQYGTLSPSVAQGAYSGWQVSLANYGSPGQGHLASLLAFNNGQLANNYLYRNAVPGQPQLNTMNTPIIMASTQTMGAACTTTGAIAQDGNGAVLSCQGGTWNTQGSRYWKDPVANYASLPACGAGNSGETRIARGFATTPTQRAFTCDGTAWRALSVDQSGTMTMDQAQINGVVTEGTACSSTGAVARDTNGLLLSCQSGVWKRIGWSPGTFHNVTASRAAGINYTNNTGTIMLGLVYINTNPSAWAYCYVDGKVVSASSQTQYGVATHTFFVPPGSTYSCSGSINGIALWGEQY